MEESSTMFISPLTLVPDDTKVSIRQRVWGYLEKENIAQNPRPVYNRIPNYKGAAEACDLMVSNLDAYKSAQVVKVNPDKPQEQARFKILEDKKTLLVPTPRLATGLFNRITPPPGAGKQLLKICASSQGVREYSTGVGLDSKIHINLIILGSVAVSPKGWRIGKGEGFADLEFSMMVSMGAVDEKTLVVSTVHDCQVLDLPDALFGEHDVPVDYIFTPTRVIKCEPKPRPKGIIWSILTKEKYESIPILKELRYRERKLGKDVRLADGSDNEEVKGAKSEATPRSLQSSKKDPALIIGNIPRSCRVGVLKAEIKKKGVSPIKTMMLGWRSCLCLFETDEDLDEAMEKMKDIEVHGHLLNVERAGEKKQSTQSKQDVNGADASVSSEENSKKEEKHSTKDKPRHGHRGEVLPAVYVGGIPRGTPVSLLKTTVRGLGVDPLRVLWVGQRRCAFLMFSTSQETEDAIEKLKDMTIKDVHVKVELGKKTENNSHNSNKSHKDVKLERKGDAGKAEDVQEGRVENGRRSRRQRKSSSPSKIKEKDSDEGKADADAKSDSKDVKKEDMESKRSPRKRRTPQKVKKGAEGGENGKEDDTNHKSHARPKKHRPPMPSIHIVGVPSMKVSEFKTLIHSKDIHGFHVNWRYRGPKPNVYLSFYEEVDLEEVMKRLEGLEIEGEKVSCEISRTGKEEKSTADKDMDINKGAKIEEEAKIQLVEGLDDKNVLPTTAEYEPSQGKPEAMPEIVQIKAEESKADIVHPKDDEPTMKIDNVSEEIDIDVVKPNEEPLKMSQKQEEADAEPKKTLQEEGLGAEIPPQKETEMEKKFEAKPKLSDGAIVKESGDGEPERKESDINKDEVKKPEEASKPLGDVN